MKKVDKQAFLNNITIASPCSQDWEKMTGDERKRHCELCQLNVYNIKEMSANEAYDLLANASGRVCVRLYKRRDGTVLTDDCPVGLRRIRNFYRKCAVATIGLLAQIGFSSLPAFAQMGPPPVEKPSQSTSENQVEIPMGAPEPIPNSLTGTVAPEPAEVGRLKAEEEVYPYQGGLTPDYMPPPQTVHTTKIEPKNDTNRLLAAGLSIMVLAAALKFIFGKLKRRSSIWIVGCTFGIAFVTIGLIWQWYW